jgi:hypothetical protein
MPAFSSYAWRTLRVVMCPLAFSLRYRSAVMAWFSGECVEWK